MSHVLPVSMMFFPSLGPLEMVILFIIVLVLFGPGKLPQVFSTLGDGIRQFKQASKDVQDTVTQAMGTENNDATSQTKTPPSTSENPTQPQ